MPGRFVRMRRPSSTKAGIRHRAVHASHAVSIFNERPALDGDDRSELFLEQVGAIEAAVDGGDPGQLRLLAGGEVLGVLPQRIAGVLEIPSVGLHPGPAGGGSPLSAAPLAGLRYPPPEMGSVGKHPRGLTST